MPAPDSLYEIHLLTRPADIYSFALTVTSRLIEKYKIDTKSIGRVEVGTETILDKSKSVKSVLMQLFGDNTNIEGVDTVNACYGGTNAFFNAVNWIESSAWDGRDAIVVAGDIALYAKGAARPSGGAGAVALLIGPDAPVVAEPGLRGTYMEHAYDFYKPDLASEYPYVDGHFSLTCYTRALDAAYKEYVAREAQRGAAAADASKPSLDRFDYVAFHAPTCKLVQKSYARLLYHDYLANADLPAFAEVAPEIRDVDYQKSLTDKTVEKAFMGLTKKTFQERVNPGIQVATNCGNMYCGSVWGGIASLLSIVDPAELKGKRIGAFSYGSGMAASFFSFRVNGDVSNIHKTLDIPSRLEARRAVPPETYDAVSCPVPCTLFLCPEKKEKSEPPFRIPSANSCPDVRPPQAGSPAKGLYPQGRRVHHCPRHLLPREGGRHVPAQLLGEAVSFTEG